MIDAQHPTKTRIETPHLRKTVQHLKTIVTPDRISITEADRRQHARDQSHHPGRLPDIVVWPHTTAEVSAIVGHANEAGLPVVGWGAGTSVEGNPIPVRGGLVLNFQQMNKILAIHAEDFQVTVQPGLFYRDMNRVLARHGLFFAPDPGANASIGGMVANNAAGLRTVKYGATRDNVLALEVVLASGEVIRTGSRSVKQSAGYDLTHLFIGSEGTLGIVTEATLKLAPLPEHFSAVIAAFSSVEAAAQVVYNIIGSGLGPGALELLDVSSVKIVNTADGVNLPAAPTLLMEFSGASEVTLSEELSLVREICEADDCLHFEAGVGREARDRLWEVRHAYFEIAVRHHPGQDYRVTDVAVPISRYPLLVTEVTEEISRLGIDATIMGHAGDGNLHTLIFFPPDDQATETKAARLSNFLVERALALDGTSTGEHGVGLGKQAYMLREHGPGALALMRRLKATLDPKGILNPGKVLDLPD